MGKRKRKDGQARFNGKRRKGPNKTILDLSKDIVGSILEYLDDPTDHRSLSLVTMAWFKTKADGNSRHYLSLDFTRNHYSETLMRTWKKTGYLDHVRNLRVVLPKAPGPQIAFRQLLRLMPGSELRSVTFTQDSRIREDSLDLLLEFLLDTPTVTKAVIPEAYERNDQSSGEDDQPGDERKPRTRVSFRCEFDRDHLRVIYFLDENNTSAFKQILEKLHDEPTLIDIWGYRKGRAPPPNLQSPATTMLLEHLGEAKALRCSGLYLQHPYLKIGDANRLQELQFRDCALVEDFLEDWHQHLSDLTTLLIDDNTTRLYDPSRLTESLRKCNVLERPCLQINLGPLNSGQAFLQAPDALQSLLESFQDSLRSLVLRFGAERFDVQTICLILETYCKSLTHFGIREPVGHRNPLAEGRFITEWTLPMEQISEDINWSSVTDFQLILDSPQDRKKDRFHSRDKDRDRIIAQWLFDKSNMNSVSINQRALEYPKWKPLPSARSFVLDTEQKAREQDVDDWALLGGHRWLREV